MKVKRLFAVIISAVIFLCFTACGVKESSTQAERLKTEAVKLINWYKTEKVGADADLSALDAANDPYGYGLALSVSDITVIGAACYYGVSADYDAYFGKLETAFSGIYPNAEAVKSASPATLCILIRTLSAMGKDPKDFCGVDLIKAATSENASYKSLYTTPYILTVMNEYSSASGDNALVSSTVEWLFSKQNDDGGWGEDYYTGDPLTDPDATAMVLAGLAPFADKSDERTAKAWECLGTYKTESGAYKSAYSPESPDTTAEVLTAVVAAAGELDEITSLLDAVLSFGNEDGGLRAMREEAPSSDITAVNALDAFYHTSVLLTRDKTN